jgi:hypothetical protein
MARAVRAYAYLRTLGRTLRRYTKARTIPIGAKKNMKTMISVIQKDLDEPAALKELDVCEAASTTAQIGRPQKMTRKRSTTTRSGPKIIASTTPTLWSKRGAERI